MTGCLWFLFVVLLAVMLAVTVVADVTHSLVGLP